MSKGPQKAKTESKSPLNIKFKNSVKFVWMPFALVRLQFISRFFFKVLQDQKKTIISVILRSVLITQT